MLLLLVLAACGPTERCYDACNTLHGQGNDVCGGPNAVVTAQDYGRTHEERMCRQACRASVEAEDRDLDEERDDWTGCVDDYARDIRAGSRKYGEPDEDACLEAYYECGAFPCSMTYIGNDATCGAVGNPDDEG